MFYIIVAIGTYNRNNYPYDKCASCGENQTIVNEKFIFT